MNTLCRDITLDKFDPQVIVGLSRGGLTSGVMMTIGYRNHSNQLTHH